MLQAKMASRTMLVYKNCIRSLHKWHQPAGTDTGINIYNCIMKSKVPLMIKDNTATWYSCGPTVYDSAHIGHAMCYVKIDIVQRILMNYFNINLITAMGITDIDDKIIKKCMATKTDMKSLTNQYEMEFWQNLNDLNILKPNIVTKVSNNIPLIINFIEELLKKDMCYRAEDDSIYFDVAQYGKYGKLLKSAGNTNENEPKSKFKKSPLDFALWKGYKDGEPYWETSFGKGRPGWHIECSAMVSNLFGNNVDFHSGGLDLLFPHHENEEAQSCAFHGNNQWVNYWIHTGHLHFKETKMSKSLKNTISIDDMLKTNSAETFRMACLVSHYRRSIDYSDEMFKYAKDIVDKLKYFIKRSNLYINSNKNVNNDTELITLLNQTKSIVDQALRDDFDTSKSIEQILRLMKAADNHMEYVDNKLNIQQGSSIKGIALTFQYINKMFNIFGINTEKSAVNKNSIDNELIDEIVSFRRFIRIYGLKSKDNELLKECDNLRNALLKHKIQINDSSNSNTLWILKQ